MNRQLARDYCRGKLDEHNLHDWHVRISTEIIKNGFLGLCSYQDKTIFLSAQAIDSQPDTEIYNTILHEIAHALTPGKQHGPEWVQMAFKIGCHKATKCGMAINEAVLDAIRSGHVVEFEEEIVTVKKLVEVDEVRVKAKIHKLTEKCPTCHKEAIEKYRKEENGYLWRFLECGHAITKELPKLTPYEEMIWNSNDPNCKHTWALPFETEYKNQCILCNAYRPYPFQILGMRALEKGLAINKGFGVFDDMGLGKTIQAFGWLKYSKPENWPVLFVVKSGLKYQFADQLLRILGKDWLPMVINKGKGAAFPGLRAYIIGYDMLRNFDKVKIAQLGIKTVILDECQQIKNVDSTRTGEVRDLVRDVQNIIPLSGTPWKNRGSELFPIFNMMDAIRFGSEARFRNQWVEFYQDPRTGKMKEGGIKNPKKFREFVADLCIRREFDEVMNELPGLSRKKLYCELPELEQDAYDEAMDEFTEWMKKLLLEGEEAKSMQIIAKLQKLRHIIALAKVPFTVDFTTDFMDESETKLCIFVHHIDVGELLTFQLQHIIDEKFPEWGKILRITSDMKPIDRTVAQNEFNKRDKCLMIASTLAAGEGLNLQTGYKFIMHERQWNPANEEQAERRFRRIGTKMPQDGFYIHVRNSVDEHFDKIVEGKRGRFNAVMNHAFTPTLSNAMICEKCKKDEESHNIAWDNVNLMQELAMVLVQEAGKRKMKLVKGARV